MQNIVFEELKYFEFPIIHFHDRIIRWLLEEQEFVRGLIDIIDDGIVPHLDFDRLTPVNRSYIPDNLREQESDIVFTVPFLSSEQTEELLIYILIEHQSTVDVTMASRVLFYMTQIWDVQRREWNSNNKPKSQWRYRPIIPIVLYTGNQKWKIPPSLSELMVFPEMFSRFVPKFDILFLSVKETDAAVLMRTDHPIGWLLTVLQKEHADKEEISKALVDAVKHINTLDAEHIGQWRRAIFYLYLLIFHRRPYDEHDELKTLVHQEVQQSEHREEGEVMAQTMAEYLFEQGQIQGEMIGEKRGEKRGEKKGEKKGEKRGETRARREVLLRILSLKFETVPEPIVKKVSAMRSLSRLDTLIEKAATTLTLDEIDWDNT